MFYAKIEVMSCKGHTHTRPNLCMYNRYTYMHTYGQIQEGVPSLSCLDMLIARQVTNTLDYGSYVCVLVIFVRSFGTNCSAPT